MRTGTKLAASAAFESFVALVAFVVPVARRDAHHVNVRGWIPSRSANAVRLKPLRSHASISDAHSAGLRRAALALFDMRRLWQHRQTCAFMPAVGGLLSADISGRTPRRTAVRKQEHLHLVLRPGRRTVATRRQRGIQCATSVVPGRRRSSRLCLPLEASSVLMPCSTSGAGTGQTSLLSARGEFARCVVSTWTKMRSHEQTKGRRRGGSRTSASTRALSPVHTIASQMALST
jgi:hypothetical protein